MNATVPAIQLEIHICDQRRSYKVTFEGLTAEDQAMTFLEARSIGGARATGQFGNHAFFELENAPIDDRYERLINFLHPLCEHQMPLSNCYGPDHFMSAAQERALYG